MSSIDQWGDGLEGVPSAGTNRSAPIRDCKTCGGDQFVTVRLRSPETTQWMLDHQHPKGHQPKANPREFHDEVAPCPNCASGVTYDYWVAGKRVQSPDSAWVREAMTR